MNIGIIGAGNIGSTLTRRLSALGHKVFVANSRGPETLKSLASETGATPVSVEEAARASAAPRLTAECRQGLEAFFAKRPAPWAGRAE